MGAIDTADAYETLRVRFERDACFIQIHRPHANNTICNRMVDEFTRVLARCEESVKVVVVEGSPEIFCFGADFGAVQQGHEGHAAHNDQNPERLYDLWLRLACGPYISVAHVRGKANAGGVGFVAACDIVICDEKATFSLSELLFGLMPACVMPFLIRRIGFAKANFAALTTQPVGAKQAQEWGLVDTCEEKSESSVRRYLVRLQRLSKSGIARYKRYATGLDGYLAGSKPAAVRANREVFSDQRNIADISRYVKTGLFPWEETGDG